MAMLDETKIAGNVKRRWWVLEERPDGEGCIYMCVCVKERKRGREREKSKR